MTTPNDPHRQLRHALLGIKPVAFTPIAEQKTDARTAPADAHAVLMESFTGESGPNVPDAHRRLAAAFGR
jgi:hypothetical protein